METKTRSTLVPVPFAALPFAAESFAAHAVAAPAYASTWAAPVRGIRMPVPATQLGSTAGVSTPANSTAANAAKGAYRKDATGGEAFEDPV
jgi:hypothetical protein